jgi:aryl-alcohol dehydrogenase-like predicted oxidoreductase
LAARSATVTPRQLGADGPQVNPIGLGAMLLSIAGRPPEAQAIRVVHAAIDAGVTFIDTADAYCLDETDFNHNERLLAKALAHKSPSGIIVATKCACRRPGGAWTVDARPEYLTEAAHASLRALGVETLDLLQLHAPDSRVPFDDSVGALAELQRQGKVRHVGLSNVSVQEIIQARRIVPIASVQNRYNLMARGAERDGVLDYCTKQGIAFIAYSPFGGSRLAPTLGTLGQLAALAKRRRVSPYRLVIAWLLAKSPVVIPIPGARRPESITDAARAGSIELGEADLLEIEAAAA